MTRPAPTQTASRRLGIGAALSALLLTAALPAQADEAGRALSCEFARECLNDACTDSQYTADLTLRPAGTGKVTADLVDVAQTLQMSGTDDDEGLMLLTSEPGVTRVFSYADGVALAVSVLGRDGLVMTCTGECVEPS